MALNSKLKTDRLVLDNYLARNFSRNTDQKKVCGFSSYVRIYSVVFESG